MEKHRITGDDLIMTPYHRDDLSGGLFNYTTTGEYNAFTCCETRTFKTRKGAEKWLTKKGYVQGKADTPHWM